MQCMGCIILFGFVLTWVFLKLNISTLRHSYLCFFLFRSRIFNIPLCLFYLFCQTDLHTCTSLSPSSSSSLSKRSKTLNGVVARRGKRGPFRAAHSGSIPSPSRAKNLHRPCLPKAVSPSESFAKRTLRRRHCWRRRWLARTTWKSRLCKNAVCVTRAHRKIN